MIYYYYDFYVIFYIILSWDSSSDPKKAVGRAARSRTRTRGRKPSEALGRLARRVAHATCRTHARRPTRDRSDGLDRHPPPPGTRGRCAPKSYNSSSRSRLSDCGGSWKPVSRRPCRVAAARSTYHTAAVPAIRSLSTKAARASRAPRHPRGAGPRAHAHDHGEQAYAYWRTHAQAQPWCPHLCRAHKTSSGADRDQVSHCTTALPFVRARAPVFIIFLLCPLPSPHYCNIIIIFSTRLSLLSKINYISTRLFVWLRDRVLLNNNNSVSTYRVFVFRCVRARCV